MDGFTGLKIATAEELPDAVPVMVKFHVVRLAGDPLDRCHQRADQQTKGNRARSGNAPYPSRRTQHPGANLLPEKQHALLEAMFAFEQPVEVEVTSGTFSSMTAAYRNTDGAVRKAATQGLTASISSGVPRASKELVTLGRTMKTRTASVLASFDRPGTSNAAAGAIIGRLERLRGSALDFRNLTNSIARSLLEGGDFRLDCTLKCDEPPSQAISRIESHPCDEILH